MLAKYHRRFYQVMNEDMFKEGVQYNAMQHKGNDTNVHCDVLVVRKFQNLC